MLFHERHRKLIFLSILGGVYLPSLSRIIPRKSINIFLKGYAAALTGFFIILITFALSDFIFTAENLIFQIIAANNICDYFMATGRVALFNICRDQAQALYDLWDEYFTGDGHDRTRKKLLDDLQKPYKRCIIVCAVFIHLMSISWTGGQLTHKDFEFSMPLGIPYRRQNPDYLIVATTIFVAFWVYTPMLLSVDLLIMEPMAWITGELIRLRQSLVDILNIVTIRDNGVMIRRDNGFDQIIFSKHEIEDCFRLVDKKMKLWIIEHQKLLIFHQKMVGVNHWPLAVHLTCTTAPICLFSFLVSLGVLSTFDSMIGLLLYLPNYLLFYFIARYGDLVKEHAADVFDCAFSTDWTVYPKHIQKNLHIIAMRTNYPLTTDIMKLYPISSKTFFQIIQTAYSLYSFFRFITRKHEIVF